MRWLTTFTLLTATLLVAPGADAQFKKKSGKSPSLAYETPTISFDNPLVGFDNPIGAFDNPLVGFGIPIGAFDAPLVGFEARMVLVQGVSKHLGSTFSTAIAKRVGQDLGKASADAKKAAAALSSGKLKGKMKARAVKAATKLKSLSTELKALSTRASKAKSAGALKSVIADVAPLRPKAGAVLSALGLSAAKKTTHRKRVAALALHGEMVRMAQFVNKSGATCTTCWSKLKTLVPAAKTAGVATSINAAAKTKSSSSLAKLKAANAAL